MKSGVFTHNGSYVYFSESDWKSCIGQLFNLATPCRLCPRQCMVNRQSDTHGFCGAPDSLIISSIFPHHGEEPPISGTKGSGTVFFSYCTLKCCFCQNYQISHEYEGIVYSSSKLADEMISLQSQGCHNINLVTATHFLPWIVTALKEASQKGLTIPIVYNCSGYESEAVIAALNGIIDIYLPDMKYGDDESAKRYSRTSDYVACNQSAIKAMFRQTGPLKIDNDGIAYRGLCIRHLVLPNNKAGSFATLDFLRSTFDPQDTFISLMAQYRPLYKAMTYDEINRMVEPGEYESVKEAFVQAGFQGFFQEIDEIDQGFIIDFKTRKKDPLTGNKQ